MDALKLRLRAKDQLHPLLQELMTGYARFKGSAEWQGRGRIVQWRVQCAGQLLCVLANIMRVAVDQVDYVECHESIRRNHRGTIQTGKPLGYSFFAC